MSPRRFDLDTDPLDIVKAVLIAIALGFIGVIYYNWLKYEPPKPGVNPAVFKAMYTVEQTCAQQGDFPEKKKCAQLRRELALDPSIKDNLDKYYWTLRHFGFELPELYETK